MHDTTVLNEVLGYAAVVLAALLLVVLCDAQVRATRKANRAKRTAHRPATGKAARR